MPPALSNQSALDDDVDDKTSEWSLIGRIDGAETKTIRMRSFPFQVGRREGLDLTLRAKTVSKLHAEIFIENRSVFLRDLSSTNGTFVNGSRVKDRIALKSGDVVQFAGVEMTVRDESPMASDNLTCSKPFQGSSYELRNLIVERAIVPHYQPVVCFATGEVAGYEVLARSQSEGLRTAFDLFSAAERSGLERELSELCRDVGVTQGRAFASNLPLFLNTHAREIASSTLTHSLIKLREENPTALIVLEVHEGAVCDYTGMRELNSILRDLKIGLAYDDFGQGQSRLMELMDVPPDYLKFDMQLIRGIDKATSVRQRAIESLVKMTREIGSCPLAEGVETIGEANTCFELGFQLVQGYLFGKPASGAEILASHIQQKFGSPSGGLRRASSNPEEFRLAELFEPSSPRVERAESHSGTICVYD